MVVAPVSDQRVFRRPDKQALLIRSNPVVMIGLALFASRTVGVITLVSDFVFSPVQPRDGSVGRAGRPRGQAKGRALAAPAPARSTSCYPC